MSYNYNSYVQINEKAAIDLLPKLQVQPEIFKWYFKLVLNLFEPSQIKKLREIYLGKTSLESVDMKTQEKFLRDLVGFLHKQMVSDIDFTNKQDGPSFLALDRSAKEARCWQELELARSGSEERSRIVALIAWRQWLFKDAVLSAYCSKKNIDNAHLSFSERAQLLKKAITHFSPTEIATIIDQAVSAEISRRNSSLQPETREKYKNKRVSMGTEVEIYEPPYMTAMKYAWYENLDRSSKHDQLAFAREFEVAFKAVAKIEDEKQHVSNIEKMVDRSRQLLTALSSSEQQETTKEHLLQEARNLVETMPDRKEKREILSLLDETSLNMLAPVVRDYWRVKLSDAKILLNDLKNRFDVLFIRRTRQRSSYGTASSHKYPDNASDLALKSLDVFRHHMGQVQALGHEIGTRDAYGEYELAHVSGTFRKPWRVLSRELYELAKTGFFDLDKKRIPVHVTLGWEEAVRERRLTFSKQEVRHCGSILNFALFAAAWANPEFVAQFKAKDEKKMKEEGAHVEIVSFLDTGRSSMIRLREYEGDPPFSTKCFGLEFRGFSFDGGEAQAQLLEALGTIGTAMKAHLCQHAERKLLALPFTLDGRLAKVWQKFEKEVTIIYQQYKRIPSLFNADSWIVKKDDENKERKLEELTRFYITLSSELDKENGLVVQMQRLIKKTSEEVESILES